MIRFACPGCQAVYNVSDNKAGKKGKCPACQTEFRIPGELAELPPATTPPPATQAEKPQPPAATPIAINPCPSCGVLSSVAPEHLGMTISCPTCSADFIAEKLGTSTPKSAVVTPPKPRIVVDAETVNDDEQPPPRSKKRASSRRVVDDDDDDEDDEEYQDVRRTRKKKRKQRGNGNKAMFRIISGALSLIAAASLFVCGLSLTVAGTFVVTLITGAGAGMNPQNPQQANAANVMMAGGGMAGIVVIGCGLIWMILAFLNLFAGIGSLTRKSYGRILTIVVSVCAALSALLDFVSGGFSLFEGNFLGFAFGSVSFLFSAAHAASGFLATIGEGAVEEYNQ